MKYKTLRQTVEVELAEWRLAKAKGECESWGHGYIRALELVVEWIDAYDRESSVSSTANAKDDTG